MGASLRFPIEPRHYCRRMLTAHASRPCHSPRHVLRSVHTNARDRCAPKRLRTFSREQCYLCPSRSNRTRVARGTGLAPVGRHPQDPPAPFYFALTDTLSGAKVPETGIRTIKNLRGNCRKRRCVEIGSIEQDCAMRRHITQVKGGKTLQIR